jgi:hypothetical protein
MWKWVFEGKSAQDALQIEAVFSSNQSEESHLTRFAQRIVQFAQSADLLRLREFFTAISAVFSTLSV